VLQVLVQAPVPSTQQVIIPLFKSKNIATAIKKVVKKENNVTSEARQGIGKKPHNIRIKVMLIDGV